MCGGVCACMWCLCGVSCNVLSCPVLSCSALLYQLLGSVLSSCHLSCSIRTFLGEIEYGYPKYLFLTCVFLSHLQISTNVRTIHAMCTLYAPTPPVASIAHVSQATQAMDLPAQVLSMCVRCVCAFCYDCFFCL